MKDDPHAPMIYVSFLVRMWREGNTEEPDHNAEWQSEIEHIQSGRRWKFQSLSELLNFIHTQAQHPASLAGNSGE